MQNTFKKKQKIFTLSNSQFIKLKKLKTLQYIIGNQDNKTITFISQSGVYFTIITKTTSFFIKLLSLDGTDFLGVPYKKQITFKYDYDLLEDGTKEEYILKVTVKKDSTVTSIPIIVLKDEPVRAKNKTLYEVQQEKLIRKEEREIKAKLKVFLEEKNKNRKLLSLF